MKESLIALLSIFMMMGCGSKSTDMTNTLNSVDNPLRPCPDSPNCVRVSVPFSPDAETLYNTIGTALSVMGAYSLDEDPAEFSYHAVFRIPVFGWKDDVHIKVDTAGSGSIAFIRSASRVGYSDLGVNRRRVKKLIKQINHKLNTK